MVERRLGRSDLLVSPIGFGAFKIGGMLGAKYPRPYDLPDEAAVHGLLHAVLDAGISLIDTAPAYGVSEERIGLALASRRAEFVLSTKAGETFDDGRSTYDFSGTAIRRSLQRSLLRLRCDAVDLLFIHSDGDDERILRETDAVETLLALRDAGLTRGIGFSGKTVAGAETALAWADVLMVEHHADDRSHEPVIADARRADVGILVKKGLASGHHDAGQAIDLVLSNPGVSSLIIGSLSAEHVRANVAAAEAAGH